MADDVIFSGPLFDGRAEAAVRRYADHAEQALGQRALDLVHARLGEVLQHPTGYYESQVRTQAQADSIAVTDGGVVYGPWLEGTGSRNSPVTRFPGYRTFRTASQELDREAADLAERELPPYLREMG